jgi:hypothetical protein
MSEDEAPLLVGLAPEPAKTTAAPVPVTAPVTFPRDFGIPQMSALAAELSRELYSVDDTLRAHHITRAQYDVLLKNEQFQKMLEQASKEWNAPTNVKERVALQAALLVERTLPTVGARLENQREDLPAVVEGLKLAAKLGGIGEGAQQAGPQERFVINIDLGGDKLTFDTTRPVQVPAQEGPRLLEAMEPSVKDRGTVALQEDAEGPGKSPPVQSKPEGTRED